MIFRGLGSRWLRCSRRRRQRSDRSRSRSRTRIEEARHAHPQPERAAGRLRGTPSAHPPGRASRSLPWLQQLVQGSPPPSPVNQMTARCRHAASPPPAPGSHSRAQVRRSVRNPVEEERSLPAAEDPAAADSRIPAAPTYPLDRVVRSETRADRWPLPDTCDRRAVQ